jgi:hypothetical protein
MSPNPAFMPGRKRKLNLGFSPERLSGESLFINFSKVLTFGKVKSNFSDIIYKAQADA